MAHACIPIYVSTNKPALLALLVNPAMPELVGKKLQFRLDSQKRDTLSKK
jgi:hypothetical protein